MADTNHVSWLHENWPAVAWFLGLFGVVVRNEYTTRRMKKTLFDDHEGLRLVLSENCAKCRMECQTKLLSDIKEIKDDVKMLVQHHIKDG